MSLAHTFRCWCWDIFKTTKTIAVAPGNSGRVAKTCRITKIWSTNFHCSSFSIEEQACISYIYILWKPKEQYIQKINTWNKLVIWNVFLVYILTQNSFPLYERLLPEGEVLPSYEGGEAGPLKAESNFRASSVSNRKKRDVLIRSNLFPFLYMKVVHLLSQIERRCRSIAFSDNCIS